MRKLLFTISILFIVIFCTKKIENPENIISFYGSHQTETKGFTPLESGTIAGLHAFAPGDIIYPVNGTPVEISANAVGALAPYSPLFLPNGTYDFFSASLNSNNYSGLIFSGGISGQLSNGNDYLWASSRNSYVNGNTNIILAYRHVACKVSVSINQASNFSTVNVTSVKFTLPSSAGTNMNLANGIIQNSSSVNPLSAIPGTGNTRTFLCLPCSATMVVEITLNATIDGESFTNKIYRASITEVFEQGYMYNIILSLTSPQQELQISITSNLWITNAKSTIYRL